MQNTYFTNYIKTTAADYTIHGFEYDGFEWYWLPTEEELFERVRVTRASTKKGGHAKLMLNDLRNEQKQALITSGRAVMVCTTEYFANEMQEYGLNRGCAFEQIISLQNGGGLYTKGDRRGYWQSGDIVIEGKQVQVKYGACSLAEFRTIDKALAECGF